MIIVYVAGLYTAPNAWEREENIRRAEEMATLIMSLESPRIGALCVHTMSRHWFGKVAEAHAIDWGLELLRRSNAVVLCDEWQGSAGTLNEIREAHKLAIPVFDGSEPLRSWHRIRCRFVPTDRILTVHDLL